jgi:signal transduction histidine kinase
MSLRTVVARKTDASSSSTNKIFWNRGFSRVSIRGIFRIIYSDNTKRKRLFVCRARIDPEFLRAIWYTDRGRHLFFAESGPPEVSIDRAGCNRGCGELEQFAFIASHDLQEARIEKGDLPIVPGYPTELKLLFQNLVSNSLKFRKKGVPPEMWIGARVKDGYWEFSILFFWISICREWMGGSFSRNTES